MSLYFNPLCTERKFDPKLCTTEVILDEATIWTKHNESCFS